MADTLQPVETFRVRIYQSLSNKPIIDFRGSGSEWQKSSFRVHWHEDVYAVETYDLWLELLKGNERQLKSKTEGLCTIVKFGNTMQLRKAFHVWLEIR